MMNDSNNNKETEEIKEKIEEKEEEIQEFVSGQEEQNLNIVSKLFNKILNTKDCEDKAKMFGKALGCLWAIAEDRPWYSKINLFRSFHTGIRPLVKKTEKLVKFYDNNIRNKKISGNNTKKLANIYTNLLNILQKNCSSQIK